MALENIKLKECPQELFLGNLGYSSQGICYYMSEYVRQKVWDTKIKSFDDALEAAKSVVPNTIIQAGKAKNLSARGGDRPGHEQVAYTETPADLAARKVYRVGLWFGPRAKNPKNPQQQVHEAVVVTSGGNDVLLFEPNFGFFHARDSSLNRRGVFEAAVQSLYAPSYKAANFHYLLDQLSGRRIS